MSVVAVGLVALGIVAVAGVVSLTVEALRRPRWHDDEPDETDRLPRMGKALR